MLRLGFASGLPTLRSAPLTRGCVVVQAIAVAAAYARDDWPLLVVAPASCRLLWADELERWLPGVLAPRDITLIFSKEDRVATPEQLTKVCVVPIRKHIDLRMWCVTKDLEGKPPLGRQSRANGG